MKFTKRFAAILLAAILTLGSLPALAADGLTRGDAVEQLIAVAQDYNPGVAQSDIIKGYGNGDLGLDDPLTRAQAFVMIRRAFGVLPELTGDNARMAVPAETFTDVPAWATEEFDDVLSAGIVAGTGNGLLSPNAPMTAQSFDTLLRRVYALEGTNLKDDYYATVNHDWMASSEIPAGLAKSGPIYDLNLTVQAQTASLIADIVANPQQPGTPEAKIKALYECVTDAEGREAAGIAPIKAYIDAIENAKTLEELMASELKLKKDVGLFTLLGFGLGADAKDSTRYTVYFSALDASMDKEFYGDEGAKKDAYLHYIETLYTLSGLSEEQAKKYAGIVWDTEKVLAAESMDPQEYADVDKTYNLYTLDELDKQFANVDLRALYAAAGLKETDKLCVRDPGLLKATAAIMDDAHLETLKAFALYYLVSSVGGTLSQGFTEAGYEFTEACYGINARQSDEQIAANQVTSLLSTYLAKAYVENYFSPEAKADVEEMIHEFIDIYKARIQALDWMSAETKAKAIRKLDTMQIKVGYPDEWDDSLDGVAILSPAEGGSFFTNVIALQKAMLAKMISMQETGVDKTEWVMSPYTVNACYNPSCNDVTFPAAILQAPVYDVNAPREANLGGIGYVIAHEITHAFDNNGAKYDENGNAADWWTAEDYAAFQSRCEAVVAWYDGAEVSPGITCNGELTLSENVADLGSAQCLIDAAKRHSDNPDYDTLFRAVANTWACTTTRQYREMLAGADVHSPEKLRCNRVLQTLDEFYETYGIEPGDGMWTEPASRVSVW